MSQDIGHPLGGTMPVEKPLANTAISELQPNAPVAVPEDVDSIPLSSGDENTDYNKVPPEDRASSSDDEGGLHITIPPRRDGSEHSDEHTPVSPAQKVRFILSDPASKPPDGSKLPEEHDFIPLDVHALFCQMDILCHFEEDETGWKEAARWLKYEEKVEAGDRWSKPHVPTASLHALQEVRKGFEENVILLDMEAPHGCIHQVAERLIDAIMVQFSLSVEKRQLLLDVLTKPHKHKHRQAMKKGSEHHTHSQGSTANQLTSTPNKSANKSVNLNDSSKSNNSISKLIQKSKQMRRIESEKEISALQHSYPRGVLPEDLVPFKSNKKLLRKIPGGSEAASILVGQVSFLEEPIMAFVRLAQSAVLADLSEVALPTRFIFLVLGPPESTSIWEYEEVGRAMGALMTDRVFCEVAYKARTRQDLLDGLDEFIDDLTVLPPSIWDPSTRLEPPETTMSMDKIRKRLMESSRHAVGEQAFHFAESAGEDKSLARTGRLFGGLWNDICRRYKWYWSDIRDGFHLQCLASIIFLYFACITPIVTFGGLLGHATQGYMGTMETILSGAICGIIYALFSGQPLTIVGATGPLLVFETILFHFCEDYHLTFMPFRFWIGIWITVMLLLIVAFDLSALVTYITRFTEESFAVLISLIFIFESFSKLAAIWDTHPIHTHTVDEGESYKCHCEHPPEQNNTYIPKSPILLDYNDTAGNMSDPAYAQDHVFKDHPIFETFNWTNLVYEDCITYQNRIVVGASCIDESDCTEHGWVLVGPACNVYTVTHSVPDVFFLCCFLFIGTFVIAFFFRNFRNANFFPAIVRSTLSDFAVLVAILACTIIDFVLALDTPKLQVPHEFKTTRDDRGWVVNPIAMKKYWLIVAAILPAALATILIFLDQQITAVIINRKEHKLRKGHGYHLDLLVLAILIAICSAMGLPWFVAATVRSVTHVRSLIRESELRAPGERSQFLGVREQRLTALVIHVLIGVSVLLTGILTHIPMAVLYGVFFYMGVTSLAGVQFVQRILILFMPEKYQPDYIYLRHLKTSRIHIFTTIQIICMVIMWIFKSVKKISIAFPLMILALCFIRKLLDFFFTQHELFWLDHILPDEHRRRKEDEALEAGQIMQDTEFREKVEEKPSYMEPESIPIVDSWEKVVAKRDYGVGRKQRPRTLSKHVIRRYRRNLIPSARLQGLHEESDISDINSEDDLVVGPDSFRERKFSL